MAMMTRYAILANPAAGGTSVEEKLSLLQRPARILQAGIYGLDISSVHEFQDAARELANQVEILVVAGGDASLDDVLNAVGNTVTLAFLPLGSGNGFAYAAGLPTDPGDAAHQILHGTNHPVDVLVYDEARRGFLAGIGVEPEVVVDRGRRLAREKPLLTVFDGDLPLTRRLTMPGMGKTTEGFLAYLSAALSVGLNGYRPMDAVLRVDGAAHAHHQILSLVISTHPFYGYGLNVNKDARLDGGLLHASTTYDPTSKFLRVSKSLVCAAQGFLFGGNTWCSTQEGKEMVLTTERPVALQVGGDYRATDTMFHFRVEEKGAVVRY